MPSIELEIQQLEKAVGKKLDIKKLEYDLQWISLDIDEVNEEEQTIKVEFNPNRPDFSSPEGIARALQGYYDLKKGLPNYEVKNGEQIMKVNPKVRDVRPFVACGRIIFDKPLTERQVITLMHMQEILHWALGRDRKKVAMRMENPLAGCLRPCQGAFSMATTQAGESQEAMAANMRMAREAYSTAKKLVTPSSFSNCSGLK